VFPPPPPPPPPPASELITAPLLTSLLTPHLSHLTHHFSLTTSHSSHLTHHLSHLTHPSPLITTPLLTTSHSPLITSHSSSLLTYHCHHSCQASLTAPSHLTHPSPLITTPLLTTSHSPLITSHSSLLTYHSCQASLTAPLLTPHLSHLTHHFSLTIVTTHVKHHSQLHFSPSRVAGAVHRASWRSCGARGRRWGRDCLSRGNRRDARAYIAPLGSAHCSTPATQKRRSQGTPEGRQGVHQTPWQCTLSHACHAKAAEPKGHRRDARAYIRSKHCSSLGQKPFSANFQLQNAKDAQLACCQ